jgi:hypothetical protein
MAFEIERGIGAQTPRLVCRLIEGGGALRDRAPEVLFDAMTVPPPGPSSSATIMRPSGAVARAASAKPNTRTSHEIAASRAT